MQKRRAAKTVEQKDLELTSSHKHTTIITIWEQPLKAKRNGQQTNSGDKVEYAKKKKKSKEKEENETEQIENK